MEGFFQLTNPHLYIGIVLSLVNAILLTIVSYKFFQIIQVSNYHVETYFNWIKQTRGKIFSRICALSFLSLGCLFVTNVILKRFANMQYLCYVGLIFYFYFIFIFVKNIYSIPEKQPLKYTKRMNRLIIVTFCIYLILTFSLIAFSHSNTFYFKFSVLALTPMFVPIAVPLVHFLNVPMENIIKQYYLTKSRKKIEKMHSLIKIGITGSYGKTSTKDILKTILSEKYKVCSTPKSFNTPMGVSKAILNNLKEDDEIFICEMGATYKHDIEKLTNFIKPSFTILTGIANQHLLTFKNIENIMETKYEIVKYCNFNSICVFNCDNDKCKQLYDREIKNRQKICVSMQDKTAFVSADNINLSTQGLTFELLINGENCGEVTTNLLGKHNIENILMAVAIAIKLDVSVEQIKKAISSLKPVPHRLEMTTNENGVTIIDDSFNANVEGTKCALEVLKLFENHRKIVVTPGLVDLGNIEKFENTELGKRIGKVCDKCIVMNENSKVELTNGLLESGFSEDNIYYCNTMKQLEDLFVSILKSGDVLLIINDLPDNFI